MRKVGHHTSKILGSWFTKTSLLGALLLLTPVSIWAQLSAFISGDATVCRGALPQQITFTGEDGVEPYTFFYKLNNGVEELTITTQTGNSVSLTIQTDIPGVYSYDLIRVTDAASNSADVFSQNATVTVHDLPEVTFSGELTSQCVSSTTYALTGGSPAGGEYSGPGVTGSNFDASVAGVGDHTLTYTYTDGTSGCTGSATGTITVTEAPTATIFYAGSPFCTSLTTPQIVTLSGTGAYTGGLYSSAPEGLSIDGELGVITPSNSTPGEYTVTYTIPPSGGCPEVQATTSVTITALPTANISYTGSPWCTTTGIQDVILTGTGDYQGGEYSVLPTGLSINVTTGVITPATSTPNTYNITYTIAASGGCGIVTATTEVTVNPVPAISSVEKTDVTVCGGSDGTITIVATGYAPMEYSINDGTDFYANGGMFTGLGDGIYTVAVRNGYGCVTTGDQVIVNEGGAPPPPEAGENATYCFGEEMEDLTATASAGGILTWYSDPGLTNVLGTGPIFTPLSTEGITNYYVTEKAGGCESTATVITITITAIPTAAINYTGSPFCTSVTTPQAVTILGTGAYAGGIYSATPGGLTIDNETGAITPSTSSPNAYTVTYTIPASGGCPTVPVTTGVTITTLPTATISYTGSPWCTTAGIQNVALTGTGDYQGGSYAASPAGLSINITSGAITPGTSSADTYTVTYTIDASGGCGAVTATTSVSVIALPEAAGTISGPTTFIPGTSGITYSVTPISGASDYEWAYTGDDVTINGTGNSVTLDFAATATAGTLSVFGINSCGNGSTSILNISQDTKTLNLTFFLEGMYNGVNGLYKAQDCEDGENFFDLFPDDVADTLTIELAQIISPYTTVFIQHGVPLSTDGTLSLTSIPGGLTGNYHIVIKHRNHVETWSQSTSFSGTAVNYDFTDALNKAWGNNMVQVGSNYCLYTGDTNQDQYVDVFDLVITFNLNKQSSYGYQLADINADGFVDVYDFIKVFNNNKKSVGMDTPLAPMK